MSQQDNSKILKELHEINKKMEKIVNHLFIETQFLRKTSQDVETIARTAKKKEIREQVQKIKNPKGGK